MANFPLSEIRKGCRPSKATRSLPAGGRKSRDESRPRRIPALASAILLALCARFPSAAGGIPAAPGFADTAFPPADYDGAGDAAGQADPDDLDDVAAGTIPRMQLFSSEPPRLQEQCGPWVTAYADLHARILKAEAPARYAVYVPLDAGFSDWLSGLVTGFLYALITGRAFQIHESQELADLSLAFESPFINWSAPAYNFRYEDFSLLGCGGGRRGDLTYSCWSYVNGNVERNFFVEKNLTDFPNNATHVFFSSNRGFSFRMFENPHHRQQLLDFGLTPRSAFGCVFRFLFLARPELWNLARERALELADPTALVIGINIRTGDKSLRRRSGGPADAYSAFFDCAAQVERARAGPEQKVVWLLTSDSIEVRRDAKRRFGSKLVTDTEHRALHISCLSRRAEDCRDRHRANGALQRAASDMFLLAAADFHVVSSWSGFAQKAAWLASNEDGHIYTIYGPAQKCGADDYTRAPEFVRLWSGI